MGSSKGQACSGRALLTSTHFSSSSWFGTSTNSLKSRSLSLWSSVSNHINHMSATAYCDHLEALVLTCASTLVLIEFWHPLLRSSNPTHSLYLSPSFLTSPSLPHLSSGISGWNIHSGLVPRRRCLVVHNSIRIQICFQVPNLKNVRRSSEALIFLWSRPSGMLLLQPGEVLHRVMTQTCRQGKDLSEI